MILEENSDSSVAARAQHDLALASLWPCHVSLWQSVSKHADLHVTPCMAMPTSPLGLLLIAPSARNDHAQLFI